MYVVFWRSKAKKILMYQGIVVLCQVNYIIFLKMEEETWLCSLQSLYSPGSEAKGSIFWEKYYTKET